MLIAIIVGILLIALLVYGEGYLSPPLDAGLVRILQAVTIIIGALILVRRAGLL